METESATLARKEYRVAVQFMNVGRDAAEAVRRTTVSIPAPDSTNRQLPTTNQLLLFASRDIQE